MTNPIPGADSEHDDTPVSMSTYGSKEACEAEHARRAAAKVGANVAADEVLSLHRQLAAEKLRADQGWQRYEEANRDRNDIRTAIAAGAPAETPKPVAVELIGVAEQIEQGAGFWHSCSGCHETEDGHPTGNYAYSNEMRCALGNGCAECGGLGAVWDNNDYSEAAGDFLAAQPSLAPIAGDVEKDAVCLDPVVEANRALLHQRSQLGIKKYGGTLDELRHSHRALMQHSLEEALDLANYLQAEIQAVDRAAMLANSSSGEAG